MGRVWAGCGQGMGRAWACCGQGVDRPWAGCGQGVGRAWACCGQAVGREWTGRGEGVGRPWAGCGQGVGRERAERGQAQRLSRGTHTMNSDRLHHFQTSTFFIISAKVLPQRGSMASMRFSLQPLTGGHSPRGQTAVSTARKARGPRKGSCGRRPPRPPGLSLPLASMQPGKVEAMQKEGPTGGVTETGPEGQGLPVGMGGRRQGEGSTQRDGVLGAERLRADGSQQGWGRGAASVARG